MVERASVNSDEQQGDRSSEVPTISGDGRLVFDSMATNLVSTDINDLADVYLRERFVSSLTVVPLFIDFGNQKINTASATSAIKVTNVSTTTVPITSVALSGTN